MKAAPKDKAGPSLRAPTARFAQDDNVWLVLIKKERGYGGETKPRELAPPLYFSPSPSKKATRLSS